MNLPGHLAVAYLVARRRARWAERLRWVALGAVLPDLVDKPAMVLGLTPYGRTVGHSLCLWAFASALWVFAASRRLAHAPVLGLLIMGGASHLLVDLVDDAVEGLEWTGYVFSAWFGWPWTNPDMWPVQTPHLFPRMDAPTTSLELATLVTVALLLRRDGARSARACTSLRPRR